MLIKLNHRLPQTADRLAAFELGVENELRRRLQLMGSAGIVSADGQDIDNDNAPCALSINAQNANAIDVAAGTVVFANGEYVDLTGSDIQSQVIDTTVADGQVFRLEYGEQDDGDLEANPYYNFAAQPRNRKRTPLEMLVIETTTVYNAQPADVLNRSIVLGVVRVENGILTVDNGRDTYSFSRPWFSPRDVEHRSFLGTGTSTVNNPHALTFNDLTVGSYTAWQALVGQPNCVLARPNGFGRYPGEICAETIPAGAFATDTTGLVTGVAGSLYAPLGFWPDRLLRASLTSDNTQLVAAWIPKGRNVVAVSDPANFLAAASLDVVYTKVTAGSLPASLTGLTSLTMGQPTANEILVAGGNFFEEMTENKVLFTDVGVNPMKFDILVDNTGRAYKRPDVIYCNTLLETLGTTPQPFTIQPRSPSRLRIALANYVVGFTEVRILITGVDENGANLSETVTFTGPGLATAPSFVETGLRVFTAGVFASVGQIQVTVRNGDGPNTTVTVFAEQYPERPETQDDLLLATVQWTGSEVTALYGNEANVALDRRIVTRGGGTKGLSGAQSTFMDPMLVDTTLGYLPSGSTKWATIVEDFADPLYMEYPNDFFAVQTSQGHFELPANSLGSRQGYISRLCPFGDTFQGDQLDAMWLRLIPRGNQSFPGRFSSNVAASVYLHKTDGSIDTFVATLGTNPYPPYQMSLVGPTLDTDSYYGVRFEIYAVGLDVPPNFNEAFQGFIFHIRE